MLEPIILLIRSVNRTVWVNRPIEFWYFRLLVFSPFLNFIRSKSSLVLLLFISHLVLWLNSSLPIRLSISSFFWLLRVLLIFLILLVLPLLNKFNSNNSSALCAEFHQQVDCVCESDRNDDCKPRIVCDIQCHKQHF